MHGDLFRLARVPEVLRKKQSLSTDASGAAVPHQEENSANPRKILITQNTDVQNSDTPIILQVSSIAYCLVSATEPN